MEDLIGNENAKQYLKSFLKKKHLGNSILFSGLEGVGKSLFAMALAKRMMCSGSDGDIHLRKIQSGNHPDMYIYKPEGKVGMHSIQSMRHFKEQVYSSPYEGPWKIFIIHNAERMLPTSSNALLKTFEEPGAKSFIILLSSKPAAILPTILSRCRKLRFRPIHKDEIAHHLREQHSLEEQKAQHIAIKSQGSLGEAISLMNKGDDIIYLRLLDVLSRGRMHSYGEMAQAVQEIEGEINLIKKEIEEELKAQNVQERSEMTALQREAMDKELDGVVSMCYLAEAERLFGVFITWFRDLHLLKEGAEMKFLIHQEKAQEGLNIISNSTLLSMDAVRSAVADAKTSILRSVKFSVVLENFFLKLHFI